MRVGIIGPGLIGGSMAIDLRRRGFAGEVLAVEKDAVAADAAVRLGLADAVVDLEECVHRCDVVVLAVPVDAALALLPRVLDLVRGTGKTVLDVCSVKEPLCKAASGHPARGRYVATHPMAGTEYSGPWAAQPGLFDGRACILCEPEASDPDALELVEKLFGALNMRLTRLGAAEHDLHVAYVSHISHITSFALAQTVLDKEKDERHIFDLASGGFESTVRLAKSSPDMWKPILSHNRDNVLEVVDTYLEKMKGFRDAIAGGDTERIGELIEDANRIKRILK